MVWSNLLQPKPKKKKVEKKKEASESPKKTEQKPKAKAEKGPDGEQMFQVSRNPLLHNLVI